MGMSGSEALGIIVRVIGPYIGDTMARSAVEAHCQKLGFRADAMTAEQLEVLVGKLGAGLNIFIGRERSAVVVADLRKALTLQAGAP